MSCSPVGADERAAVLTDNLRWSSIAWGDVGGALVVAAGERLSIVQAALHMD
ncbi:MAG TPA: hypothetical protein VK698_05420 [Kofleriaceae bacterium]|nr:hypothetical protein [Kofleriaceae bacterium]